MSKRPVLRFLKETLRRSVQQAQLDSERGGTLGRQGTNQVFQHGPQATRDLDARTTELADFGDGEGDEVFPVGRAVDEANLAAGIAEHLIIEPPTTDMAQQMVYLIEGQDGGGR